MIEVDAKLFKLVSGVTSTEEERYYLHGVHIEPHKDGGAIMVATDGHRMIVAHDPDGKCEESAIVKLPKFALAQCSSRTAKRMLRVEAASATVLEAPEDEDPKYTAIVTVHDVIIDGTYPDWRRVATAEKLDFESAAPTSFNALYLKEMGALGIEISKAFGSDYREMNISLSDGRAPVVIRWAATPNIFAILMPMRSMFEGGDRLPEFIAA